MTLSNRTSSRSNVVIAVALIIIIVLTIIGIWILKNGITSSDKTHQITYRVETTGGFALIVYTQFSGQNTRAEIMTTPFNKTVSLPAGVEVFLTASNPSQTGTVSCKIILDNRDWKESKATHPVDSVACGGIIR